MNIDTKLKVAIIYRVIQGWRAPVFERLDKKFNLKIFYGCDFKRTKVVSSPGPYNFASKKMPSVPLTIRKQSGNMLLPLSPSLFFELLAFKPDIVVCEGASNFMNNLFAFAYCKLFKKPMIQWGLGQLKGKSKSQFRKLIDPFIRPVERRADAIISYSSYGAEYYRSLGIADEKIFVAVNVVDTDKRIQEVRTYQAHAKPNKDGVFKILYVGAIEPNKKVETLIRAFAALHKTKRDTELHIVGDGDSKPKIEGLCKKLNVLSAVTFYGKIDGALASIACNMDVFVMPGLGGLAISDMLSHGVPVICSNGDGCEGDLIDGKNGFVIEDIDENKIVTVLLSLIDDTELLKEMKIAARKTIDRYNINTYVSSIDAALQYTQEK